MAFSSPDRARRRRCRGPRRAQLVLLLGGILISVLAGLSPSPALGFFGKAKGYATELSANSVAIGDVNGDGRPDLVVAGGHWRSPGGVAVLLGRGDGSFGKPKLFAAGLPSYSVAIANLNGDRRPDLAVTDSAGVSVLLGSGNGTFVPPTTLPAGKRPSGLAIGDLNGDGRPDLVVVDGGSNSVSVLLGNGNGSFGAATEYIAGFEPSSLAIADLNGDGRPDLAVDSPEGPEAVSVLLGNGDGSFGAPTHYGIGGLVRSVAIGDLNGDGRPDLAAADFTGNAVAVLLGNGDGSFGAAESFSVSPRAYGIWPNAVAIGRLNGDAFPDLAVSDQRSGEVSVLLGTGAGTFGKPKDFAVGREPRAVAVGDLNGDSRPDLVVANGVPDAVSVLLNGRSSAVLSLAYRSGGHRFSGRLRSVDPVCANDRRVTVLRRRNGTDRKVGTATTSTRGTYRLAAQVPSGTFYARVRASPACRAAASKAIAVRSGGQLRS